MFSKENDKYYKECVCIAYSLYQPSSWLIDSQTIYKHIIHSLWPIWILFLSIVCLSAVHLLSGQLGASAWWPHHYNVVHLVRLFVNTEAHHAIMTRIQSSDSEALFCGFGRINPFVRENLANERYTRNWQHAIKCSWLDETCIWYRR